MYAVVDKIPASDHARRNAVAAQTVSMCAAVLSVVCSCLYGRAAGVAIRASAKGARDDMAIAIANQMSFWGLIALVFAIAMTALAFRFRWRTGRTGIADTAAVTCIVIAFAMELMLV